MSESKKSEGRIAALATYIVAVLAIAAGIFLPITDKTFSGAGFSFAAAPFMQLGGALAKCGLPINMGFDGTYSYPVGAFDAGAVLLLLYALTAVLALVLLIPAFAAKAEKSRNVIFVSELIVLSTLLPLTVLEFLRDAGVWNLNIIFAFCAVILMLFIQCLVYKKSSGVVKIILFVFSAVAALFAATDVTRFAPALAAPFESLANALKGKKPFETGMGLYSVNGKNIYAKDLFGSVISQNYGFFADGSNVVAVTGWLAFTLVSLLIVNLFLDMLGMGKKTNRFMVISNVIRYSLEFALIAALAVTIIFAPANYGLTLYLIALIALIQLLIQIGRAAKFRKAAKAANVAAKEAEKAESAEEPVPSAVPEETAAASGEPVVETRQVVYNVNTIYNGPTDEFIKKLTVDEKVEFARLFLEKRTGSRHGVPDYIIGGDNSRFFSMLFIYFTRIRDLVSDGLMNKFYEEVKLM